jgi:hypothetical protein
MNVKLLILFDYLNQNINLMYVYLILQILLNKQQ